MVIDYADIECIDEEYIRFIKKFINLMEWIKLN